MASGPSSRRARRAATGDVVRLDEAAQPVVLREEVQVETRAAGVAGGVARGGDAPRDVLLGHARVQRRRKRGVAHGARPGAEVPFGARVAVRAVRVEVQTGVEQKPGRIVRVRERRIARRLRRVQVNRRPRVAALARRVASRVLARVPDAGRHAERAALRGSPFAARGPFARPRARIRGSLCGRLTRSLEPLLARPLAFLLLNLRHVLLLLLERLELGALRARRGVLHDVHGAGVLQVLAHQVVAAVHAPPRVRLQRVLERLVLVVPRELRRVILRGERQIFHHLRLPDRRLRVAAVRLRLPGSLGQLRRRLGLLLLDLASRLGLHRRLGLLVHAEPLPDRALRVLARHDEHLRQVSNTLGAVAVRALGGPSPGAGVVRRERDGTYGNAAHHAPDDHDAEHRRRRDARAARREPPRRGGRVSVILDGRGVSRRLADPAVLRAQQRRHLGGFAAADPHLRQHRRRHPRRAAFLWQRGTRVVEDAI